MKTGPEKPAEFNFLELIETLEKIKREGADLSVLEAETIEPTEGEDD